MSSPDNENSVSVKHLNASILREGNSTSPNLEVQKLVNLRREGDKFLLKKEAIPDEAKQKEPNFSEIKLVLGKVDDISRRDELISKVSNIREIVEGKDNSEHFKMVAKTVASMPGIIAAIAKETGMSPSDIQKNLRDGNLGAITNLDKMFKSWLTDSKFVDKLKNNVGNIEMTTEMINADVNIIDLKDEIFGLEKLIDLENDQLIDTTLGSAMHTNNKKNIIEYEKQIKEKNHHLKINEITNNRGISTFSGKVDSVFERSLKEYYNDSLLADAIELAKMDAEKKTEDIAKEASLETKRKETAKKMLEKYLRLSYLKYNKKGKVTGWRDDVVRKLIKKDLLSSSPSQMARTLLEQVYNYRETLPGVYKEEIDKMAVDMGVTTSTNFKSVLESIDTDYLAGIAANEMPKVLGYGYARGFYFDRLKWTPVKAQFIKEAYGKPEFFTEAIAAKKECLKQFNAEFNKKGEENVLSNTVGISKKIKEILLGKDWTSGLKRLLSILAIGGSIGGLGSLGSSLLCGTGASAGAGNVLINAGVGTALAT